MSCLERLAVPMKSRKICHAPYDTGRGGEAEGGRELRQIGATEEAERGTTNRKWRITVAAPVAAAALCHESAAVAANVIK